jgi:hypothetical protein
VHNERGDKYSNDDDKEKDKKEEEEANDDYIPSNKCGF